MTAAAQHDKQLVGEPWERGVQEEQEVPCLDPAEIERPGGRVHRRLEDGEGQPRRPVLGRPHKQLPAPGADELRRLRGSGHAHGDARQLARAVPAGRSRSRRPAGAHAGIIWGIPSQ